VLFEPKESPEFIHGEYIKISDSSFQTGSKIINISLAW